MELKIYVDRLKEGQIEKFSGETSSEILGTDPKLASTLFLSGESYIANDHLIVKLQAKTNAYLPCSICNQDVELPLIATDIYYALPIDEIGSIFDLSEIVREALLLEVPQFAECNQGNCPQREGVKKYLSKTTSHMQFPFSSL